jgi:DNA-binding response OmpR family regulator
LDQSFYRDAHLFVHLHQQVVMLDGETIRLNRMEYRLLAILVEHAGEVMAQSILFMEIWGYGPEILEGKVDTCIRGLRKKLGVYADQCIETVFGFGYCFRPFLPRG